MRDVHTTISDRRLVIGDHEIPLDEALRIARRAGGFMKPGVREVTPPDLSSLGTAGAAAEGAWQIAGTGVSTLVGLPVTLAADLFGLAWLAAGVGALLATAVAGLAGGLVGGAAGAASGAVGVVRGSGRGLAGDTWTGAQVGAAAAAVTVGGLATVGLAVTGIAAGIGIGIGNVVANAAGTVAGAAAALVGGTLGGVASVLRAPFLAGRSGAERGPQRDVVHTSVDLTGVAQQGHGKERDGVAGPEAPGREVGRGDREL